jgi:uncharacterized membrane protein YhaH (DUF805 family)
MTFSDSINSCFEGYSGFSGRASRSEYWWFAAFIGAVDVVAAVADAVVFGPGSRIPLFGLIAAVALLLPTLAVGFRRLHDTDRSGWWLLIAFVPLIGPVVLIVWFCTRGTDGANRYGSDPLRTEMPPHALYRAP